MELEETRPALERQGLRLSAISYDSVAILNAFATRRRIKFPLLSDEGSKVIRALGILNESVPKSSGVYGIPHPMTLVVDPKGRILSKHFEPDYKERETVGSILSHHLNVRTGLVENVAVTKHLKVITSASNAVMRPNQHIRLRLDVELKPKMHVYAPGVKGYKPVAWTLKASPAFTIKKTEFPPAKTMRMEAIQETVPVYDGAFTSTMELVMASGPEMKKALGGSDELILEGNFYYQACDDKVCYLPDNVPVRWKLRFEPLDTVRAPAGIRHNLGR